MCGLRSKLNYGILNNYITTTDIMGLTEVKCNASQITQIDDFNTIFMSAKHRQHQFGGVYGICVFIRKKYKDFVHEIDSTYSKNVLWLRIDKKIFGLNFILGTVYIPPEGSKHYDDDIFDIIANDIIHIKHIYNEESFCFIGDFNSRTGLLDDFIKHDNTVTDKYGLDTYNNDLFKSKHNLESQNIMTDRVSQDQCVNKNGVCLIELCRHFDLKIVNGRFGSDKGTGAFTCVTANGSSVVDYVIMSSSLMPHIARFLIEPYDPCMSDVHKPLQVVLTNRIAVATDNACVDGEDHQDNGFQYNMLKTKWVSNSSVEYKKNFVRKDIENLCDKLQEVDIENKSVTQVKIDDLCDGINNVLIKSAIVAGISTYKMFSVNSSRKKKTNVSNPWFCKECKAKRREYLSNKNRLKKMNYLNAIQELKCLSKEYKQIIISKKKAYIFKLHTSIRNLKSNNPKDYWNIINESRNGFSKKENNVPFIFLKHILKN